MQKITPFLWFDTKAEDAAKFYVSIFKKSKIDKIGKYDKASAKASGMPEGSVMVVEFTLDGQLFNAINGGPVFKFTPAISFVIDCQDQKEVDHFWNKLTEGGEEVQCGWLTDKYGVTWQVVPSELNDMLSDPDKKKAGRAMEAMIEMKKLDIGKLRKAFEGK